MKPNLRLVSNKIGRVESVIGSISFKELPGSKAMKLILN
jgi:hypothetical protein